jgi:hypothetical protein
MRVLLESYRLDELNAYGEGRIYERSNQVFFPTIIGVDHVNDGRVFLRAILYRPVSAADVKSNIVPEL